MTTEIYLLIASLVLLLILLFISLSKRNESSKELKNIIEKLTHDTDYQNRLQRQELTALIQNSFRELNGIMTDSQKVFQDNVSKSMLSQEERFKTFALENEQKLSNMRETIEKRLTYIQTDNNKKLDEMRQTVDEKLQKTLEERISKSFQLVHDSLEQVHKDLGEMRNLATGVGDLKKVLTNVKTRGIIGEIQLGAIFDEILAPGQYSKDIATKRGSTERVEFAVKLPTEDGNFIYLPVDSKFPDDTYSHLREAYDSGIPEDIEAARKHLRSTIAGEAKKIHDKYIDPPNTTDFAIMFLPFEGLYAEVVSWGTIELLQKYNINITGPSTMAALLNSLQMGFRTFELQKRSSEVWTVLGAVKTEFDKFGSTLESTKKDLDKANERLDELIGTRTRQIQRKLKGVPRIGGDAAQAILSDEPSNIDTEE